MAIIDSLISTGNATKVTNDQWYFDDATKRIVSSIPIQTTLNSLYLRDHLRLSSAGTGVALTNMDTGDNSYPVSSVLKDHSVPINRTSAGVVRASADDFGDLVDPDGVGGFEPRGPAAASGSVDFVLDTTLVPSLSIYEVQVIVEENIQASDTLHYTIYSGTTSNDRAIYEQVLTGVSVSQGATLSWDFEQNSNILSGSVLHIEMLVDKGTSEEPSTYRPLVVRPSQAEPDKIYARVLGRAFSLKEVAYLSELEAIISGAEYKGAWDVTNEPTKLDNLTAALGDTYRVSVVGSHDLGFGTTDFEVGDFVVWNGTGWDYYPQNSVTINQIENASLAEYDITVDSNYTGATEVGSSLFPFKTLAQAINNASDGSTILVKGNHTITSEISLPNNKSLYFYGQNGATVGYSSYNSSNGNVFYVDGVNNGKSYTFNGLTINNAGGYGILCKNTYRVVVEDCTLINNAWNGQALSTILPSGTSGLLGYDSTNSDLQNFYAGSNASNGGALRVENSTFVEVIGNTATKNLRGLRLEDCGVNGAGFVTRNVSTQNIESGIYLAAGSVHSGCQNIVVAINSSSYNANNGLLCIGGINNKFSQNEVNGNWNAGICLWGAANLTARDCGLYDNNRSQYNGIGNDGDAKASVQINEAYDYLGDTISTNPAARFIAEILDTQIHYTGLGSNTDRIGVFIHENVGDLAANEHNIIRIDDVGFTGQDYAFDFSEVDSTNLKIVLGDNSYTNIGVTAVKPPFEGDYYELPFSNHTTDLQTVDVTVDVTGSVIIKEGPYGARLNPYKVNDLRAEAYGTDIKVILKDSNKIQFTVPVSGLSFDGVQANSILGQAIVQFNDIVTNTTGYASTSNPVTSFVLSGNNLTIGLQDGTSYTVDVTTLLVDENKFVTSGALNGNNLELTMNDSSVVSIDATNMINGSTLPALSNDWFISYGNNSGDQVTSPSIVATLEDQQPFYNGDFLEKGEEYVWTHDVNGYYVLGVYTGAEETSDESDITLSSKWSNVFRFTNIGSNRVSENSDGVDVASRYATGYAISNNTVFALAYDSDNYLKLYDISGGDRVLIGQSNTALVGSNQVISFGGQNQPNAKFPVMIKRYAEWEIVHDFDNSETSLLDGLEEDTIIKSNISVSPGEKLMLNLNFAGRSQVFGLDYSGASSGVSNAHYTISNSFLYGTSEQLIQVDNSWSWNTSATGYDASVPKWSKGISNNVGMISIVYNSDNSVDLYSEDLGEVIASKSSDLDGTPFNVYFGVNEATTTSFIPTVSKQTLGQGSQPTTSFAPDISNQSFDVTKSTAFNIQIALDSGSDIVNQYVETNAPSWAVLNQATGVFAGTAPSTTGTHVVDCKAANVIGGSTSFQITLNVVEPVYTNTKSLKFADGVSSYLGGNAALVTSLERASNGSGAGDAWTIAFWFKGSTSNTGQTLFYFGSADVTNNGHIEVKQTNHNGLKRLRFRYGSNNNHIQLTTPSGSVNPSNWQHVLVSYDGGTTGASSGSVSSYYSRFKIYIDGSLMTTSNTHSNFGYSGSVVGQNYRFGRFSSGNYARDVLLNQLAIWDSDQSSNVSGLYNSGSTQDISLLQASTGNMDSSYVSPAHYYEIENSVTAVQDLSGTAHFVGYNFSSSDLVTDAP